MPPLSYPNLVKPEPGEIVTRYLSIAQFIWIATQQKLPLIRVDVFQDLFEGSAPQSLIEQQAILAGGRNRTDQQMSVQRHYYPNYPWPSTPSQTSAERWAEMTAWRRYLTYSTHASCWRWGPEPDGMWRLYCGEKEGVALQTTFARLEQSLEQALETEPLLVGKVQYGDYETISPFTADLDHVMYKREAFAFEQEVRVLRMDQGHYNNLCSGITKEKLPPSLPILWDIKTAIENILVHPYVSDWYLEAVCAAARLVDETFARRVRWSKLRKSPTF
jgi:hypothetical protein